ncbi:MAG: TolC family protein [Gemmatimonadota bacterium]
MTRWYVLLALSAGGPAAAAAQDTTTVAPTATLTLAEALATARTNSPTYRQTLNDAGPARWGVRSAYGDLLPSASVSGGLGYTGSGQSSFGGTTFSQTSPSYNSNYGVNLQWNITGRTLSAPGQAKALERATTADINAAGTNLKQQVTTQYLQSLQATAQVEVARQQVLRNIDFLKLAQARYQVGQATLLDVRQAEVTKGTSDVALLRAIQTDNEAKLELIRRMGVVAPIAIDQLKLTDSFPVTAPEFNLDQLLAAAAEQNPELLAFRARDAAAGANVSAARSEFLPSLSMSAGWNGFTQQFTNSGLLVNQALTGAQGQYANCLDNNTIRSSAGLAPRDCLATTGLTDPNTLDPQVQQQIISSNSVFPFNFSRQPFSARLSLSLPIFTGFSRSLRVAQARAQLQDADESVRARALQLRTDVQGRYLALGSAYKTIAVQQANREAAREQLRLAQDRYRLGSGTALELSDAQNAIQRAEGDYVNAIYGYHIAIAALEAAVGRPLR